MRHVDFEGSIARKSEGGHVAIMVGEDNGMRCVGRYLERGR
jgi:hypothetical protein